VLVEGEARVRAGVNDFRSIEQLCNLVADFQAAVFSLKQTVLKKDQNIATVGIILATNPV